MSEGYEWPRQVKVVPLPATIILNGQKFQRQALKDVNFACWGEPAEVVGTVFVGYQDGREQIVYSGDVAWAKHVFRSAQDQVITVQFGEK